MWDGVVLYLMAGKLVYALVGAVAAVLLSFVPFSTVIGGALAGYLNGEEGLSTGAWTGLFAALPLVLLAVVVGLGSAMLPEPLVQITGSVFVVILLFVVLLYSVVPAALGGWLGAELS